MACLQYSCDVTYFQSSYSHSSIKATLWCTVVYVVHCIHHTPASHTAHWKIKQNQKRSFQSFRLFCSFLVFLCALGKIHLFRLTTSFAFHKNALAARFHKQFSLFCSYWMGSSLSCMEYGIHEDHFCLDKASYFHIVSVGGSVSYAHTFMMIFI